MSETISLSQLIARLSEETGADSNTSRVYVREFFAAIAEALAAGETVEVPGLGTFVRSTEPTDDGQPRVLFQPDSGLAADVNAPFAMFEAQEVPDSVSDAELEETAEAEEPAAVEESVEIIEPVKADEPEVAVEPKIEEATAEAKVEEPEVGAEEAEITEVVDEILPPAIGDDEEPVIEPSFPEDEEEDTLPEPEVKRGNGWLWILLGALALGIVAGVYFGLTIDVTGEESGSTAADATEVVQEPVAQDTEDEASAVEVTTDAPAASQPVAQEEPVYETVSSTNYLSSMARRHYGSQIYWVYIYEANADKLGHPDRIAPGTRLLIPPKSSFPAAASEAEAREIAQRKATEIQSRFR